MGPFGCKNCIDNYHLEQGQCVSNDPLCEKYIKNDNTEVCDDCVPGYFVDDHHQCQQKDYGCQYRNGECVRCYKPFFYLRKEKTCYLPGCKTYCR